MKLSRPLSLEDGTDIHPKTSVTNESTLTTTQNREDLNYIASKVWNLASLDPAAGHVLNTAKMLACEVLHQSWNSVLTLWLKKMCQLAMCLHVFCVCIHLTFRTQFGCVTLACAISFMLSFICSVQSFLPSFLPSKRAEGSAWQFRYNSCYNNTWTVMFIVLFLSLAPTFHYEVSWNRVLMCIDMYLTLPFIACWWWGWQKQSAFSINTVFW